MTKQRYVGLSVSFCIQAICQGIIDEDQIAFIVPGFTLDETNTREAVFERYKVVYWHDFPERAWEVFQRIEIRQHRHSNIADGCWVKEEDFIPEAGEMKIHTADLPFN